MKKIFVATGSVLLPGNEHAHRRCAQTQSREDILREQSQPNARNSRHLKTLLLSPSEEDRAAYADFLRLPDTGLDSFVTSRNIRQRGLQKE